jgi:predicted anti-sigma-YlaC factor YlaD
MRCDQVRDVLSARLDGEEMPGEGIPAEAHLTGCVDCRQWYDAAALLTRMVRTSVAAAPIEPADDQLLDVVIAAAPGIGWSRAGRLLRIALGLLGFGQFVLGIAQIASIGMAGGVGSAGGMTSDHLLHESAAWNVAIGAGYLWIAIRRARPADVLPILTAFVAVLALLSISDLLNGEVVATTLLTHVLVGLGYVILLVLRHPGFDAVTPPGKRRWRLRLDEERLDDDREDTRRQIHQQPAQGRSRGATASATAERRKVA